METVRDLLTRALRTGGVIPEGEPPSPELIVDGLESMKDLVGTWEASEGIPTTLADSELGTELQEPRVVLAALHYELAVLLARENRVAVTPDMLREMKRFKRAAQNYFMNDLQTGVDPALLQPAKHNIEQG